MFSCRIVVRLRRNSLIIYNNFLLQNLSVNFLILLRILAMSNSCSTKVFKQNKLDSES